MTILVIKPFKKKKKYQRERVVGFQCVQANTLLNIVSLEDTSGLCWICLYTYIYILCKVT